MLQLERQKLILEYLKQNRKATTNAWSFHHNHPYRFKPDG